MLFKHTICYMFTDLNNIYNFFVNYECDFPQWHVMHGTKSKIVHNFSLLHMLLLDLIFIFYKLFFLNFINFKLVRFNRPLEDIT